MKRLRVAVIGCGLISEFHLLGWARIPEVEIVAFVDPSMDAAAARRDSFAPSAAVYPSVESMLATERLDLVDVISPPAHHATHARAARNAGLHVICQKPLTESLDSARELVAAFEGPGPMLAVHENHIFRPWFREVLAVRDTGTLGALRRVRLEQLDAVTPPQALNRESESGVLLQYGIHLVDMVRELLGTPSSVRAWTRRINPEIRGESHAFVEFGYSDGAVATVEVAWKNGGVPQGGALVIGDEGEAFYEGTMTRGGAGRFRIARGTEVLLDEPRDPDDEYVEAFAAFERACVDHLLAGTPLPQPAATNLETLEMTFAAYAAAKETS